MTHAPKPKRMTLWQPIRIELSTSADHFVIEVGADDTDVGLFIADGHFDVPPPTRPPLTRAAVRVFRELLACGLSAELDVAMANLGVFKREPHAASVRVYCHRAVAVPGAQSIGLLCSLTPMPADRQALPAQVLAEITQAAARHRADLAAHAIDAALRKEQDARMLAQMSPDRAAEFKDITDKFPSGSLPPSFDFKPFVASLPPGLVVKLPSDDPDVVERAAQRAVVQNPDERNPPPREGWYQAVVAGTNPKQRRALITWVPHRGLPPYPEVRAAAQRRLPRAFVSTKRSDITPPEIADRLNVAQSDDVTSLPFDPSRLDWLGDEDFSLGFEDPADVARTAKDRLREHGFECVGWYQPHHIHSEDTWGIYIDAPLLDEMGCSIAEDLRTHGVRRGRNALAAKLALVLVYRHELFHAKVEAALTWLELQALQPKFRPYNVQVYAALKGTDGHLEEALANFASWAWISADAVMQQLTGQLTDEDRKAIERVIRYHLDLSPPGYRRWSEGRHAETWRTLTTQMVQGRPKLPSPGIGLPIEPMLRGVLPFDFDEWRDVPCRFLGQGRIASSLHAAPATLNVPQRQEVRKVIQRHFSYELVRGAGKGSHEKFRHASGRMFPLPMRDPVSMTVFKNFLDHFELSKNDYDQIRHTV